MNLRADTEEAVIAVPLLKAVFCVDCELVSNSHHDVCTVCGSRSLISLSRLLGGTLRGQPKQPITTAKYNLELTAKVHEVPAKELNRVIESVGRLTDVGGAVKWLHINVESAESAGSALENRCVLRAA